MPSTDALRCYCLWWVSIRSSLSRVHSLDNTPFSNRAILPRGQISVIDVGKACKYLGFHSPGLSCCFPVFSLWTRNHKVSGNNAAPILRRSSLASFAVVPVEQHGSSQPLLDVIESIPVLKSKTHVLPPCAPLIVPPPLCPPPKHLEGDSACLGGAAQI